jgi:hypothetical protein
MSAASMVIELRDAGAKNTRMTVAVDTTEVLVPIATPMGVAATVAYRPSGEYCDDGVEIWRSHVYGTNTSIAPL